MRRGGGKKKEIYKECLAAAVAGGAERSDEAHVTNKSIVDIPCPIPESDDKCGGRIDQENPTRRNSLAPIKFRAKVRKGIGR